MFGLLRTLPAIGFGKVGGTAEDWARDARKPVRNATTGKKKTNEHVRRVSGGELRTTGHISYRKRSAPAKGQRRVDGSPEDRDTKGLGGLAPTEPDSNSPLNWEDSHK